MKSVFKKIASMALIPIMALTLGVGFLTAPANAACDPKNGIADALNPDCSQPNNTPTNLIGNGGIVNTIVNVFLFLVGLLCVIMIIFGGFRYVTSSGDKQKVDSAKNTILYAIVGLIVALIAWALVNWVFQQVGNS